MSLNFCKKTLFLVLSFSCLQIFSKVATDFPSYALARNFFDKQVSTVNKLVQEEVAVCCEAVNSLVDREVIPESRSIESKLDDWIGPLTETIDSKVDAIGAVNLFPETETCQSVKSTIDEFIVPELTTVESKLDNFVEIPTDFPMLTKGNEITGGVEITSPGLYFLNGSVTGCIKISADRVIIDMCGFTLFCDSADAVIEISPNLKNIEIKDGKIKGAAGLTNDGILTGSGCQLVKIDDVVVYSCNNGIKFNGTISGPVKGCKITDCDVEACNKGIVLSYAIKNKFASCRALDCKFAGFEQEYSQFNIFEKCKALKTSNAEADQRAIGFKSFAGTGNLYRECVAEGTQKTDVSDFCHGAIGFLLTGTEGDMEIETKIINCIANSTSVLDSGTSAGAIAYGIFLGPVLLDDIFTNSFLADYGSTVFSVAWSPDGRYLAVGGDVPTSPKKEIQVFSFDGSSLLLAATEDYGTRVFSVSFSPDGKYLAVGGFDPTISNADIQVYSFDGSSLVLTATENYGDAVFSVDWSPDGKYLAVGGQIPTSPKEEIQLYSFDGSSLTLIDDEDYSTRAYSVDWSPDGKYLAVGGLGGGKDIQVFSFDGSSLSLIDDEDYGFRVFSVDWSPDGKYLAVGGQIPTSPKDEIQVYSFDGSTLLLTVTADYGGSVESVAWSPDGKYLAVGGFDPTIPDREIQLFSFDGSSLSLIDDEDYGGIARSVAWSPDGRYLAVGGDAPTVPDREIQVFEVMAAPSGCLIDSNKVCNTTGGGFAGIGILGTGDNLYIKNILYANDVHFNGTVIPRFGNFFGPLLDGMPNLFDNVFV